MTVKSERNRSIRCFFFSLLRDIVEKGKTRDSQQPAIRCWLRRYFNKLKAKKIEIFFFSASMGFCASVWPQLSGFSLDLWVSRSPPRWLRNRRATVCNYRSDFSSTTLLSTTKNDVARYQLVLGCFVLNQRTFGLHADNFAKQENSRLERIIAWWKPLEWRFNCELYSSTAIMQFVILSIMQAWRAEIW